MSSIEGTADGTYRRKLKSISTGVGVTIFVSILGAVSVRLITTHLGATDFGIFVLVQAFVSLVWNFTDLGLSQVLQRDIARGDQDEERLLSYAMGLRVTLGLIVVPVAAAIGLLVYSQRSDALKIGLVLLLCSVPFSVAQEVAAAHFTARLRNVTLAFAAAVQQVVFVALVIVSVELHKSITFCVGAACLGSVVSAAFTIIAARREITFSPAFDKEIWYSMLRTSTPIGLAYIIGSLYLKADTVILSFLSTVKQIGYYGVSYAIVSVFLVLPAILTRTFIPGLVRASDDALEGEVNSSLAFCAVGGTLSATGVMVCGPTIVRVISGPHFGPAVTPLRILGLGLIFIFMTNGLSSVCLARGFTSKLFVMSVMSLVLNIVLNIAAIPTWGIEGAATATLACEVLSVAFMTYLVVKYVNVRPRVFGALWRPLAAGVITSAVLSPIYLHHNLSVTVGLILIPIVGIIYLGLLVAFRGVPMELTSVLRSLKRSAD